MTKGEKSSHLITDVDGDEPAASGTAAECALATFVRPMGILRVEMRRGSATQATWVGWEVA